ncbi:ketoacyl-ACP synthase III family protein [Rhizocola hellebori]|uniref:ketoacyl-ACP synthase III family protein n=1 Tax=Rhizocola hellebori TaxID=1392758 RepID=UPI0019420E69|nr:ketoacyl-ACP synthase III family protein [Rhizocola hellebori]
MRVEKDIFVRGNGTRLPETLLVSDAIASGECDPRLVRRTEVVSVAVSPRESAAEMAVVAARVALERAGSTSADVDLILHADTYHQGQDLWPVASYIQRETVRNTCSAIEIRQMSCGGMAAVDLATSYLTAQPGRADALLTTADRMCLPGVNRWSTDPGTPYADGATAIVLSTRGGYAKLRSIVMYADSELEGVHRGDEPFSPAPFSHRIPVDFEAAKQAFTRQFGLSFAIQRVNASQRFAIKQACADADAELAEMDWVILPHFGHRRLEVGYFREFGIDPARTTWEWSRTIGHLGAGDQFASLGYLVDTGRAKPGDRCLMVGVGAGYTWGCAVVDIIAHPGWV